MDAVFYVGITGTEPDPAKGIFVGTLDTTSGQLSPLRLAATAANPNFLAVSPRRKFLYAVMAAGGPAVGAFAIEPDHSLRLVNTQPANGRVPCHVWLDHSDSHVLIANYGEGNFVSLPILPDGSLGKPTATVQLTGNGPHPTRQQHSYAHGIYTDPGDQFAYVCDLGSDRVWTFHYDRGTFTPAEPPAGLTPPGAGPRHFALHPNGRFAYANNEMGLSVTAFTRDPLHGTLHALQSVPTSTEHFGDTPGITTSELICHPNGRWLYVSSRGDNTLVAYAIGTDGRLTLTEIIPATVDCPRGMGLDPSGEWLVVAGQMDGQVRSFHIDPTNGRLSPTPHTASAPAPVCVVFA